MKNQIKQLCVAFVTILCISLCTVQAFATPDVVTDTAPPVQTEAPIVTEVPTVATVPATVAPTVAPDTEPATQPETEAPTKATQPVTHATQKPTYATKSPTTATNPPATNAYQPAQTTPAVNNNQPVDNNQSQPTDTFDSDKRVDTDNLDDNDWAEITEKLKGNGSKSTGDDFGFIQNNNDDDDNGLWILITGILLILAGIGIIVTLITLHIRKKKGLSKDKKNPPSRNSGNGRRVTPAEKKQINKRSKYDTAEVYVPRRTSSKSKNSYGGTRYKH